LSEVGIEPSHVPSAPCIEPETCVESSGGVLILEDPGGKLWSSFSWCHCARKMDEFPSQVASGFWRVNHRFRSDAVRRRLYLRNALEALSL
jgi:hypothetical protein